jgi:hypothetical protein
VDDQAILDARLAPNFTKDQLVELDTLIQEHASVQYLLQEYLTLAARLTAIEDALMQKQPTSEAVAVAKAEMGSPLILSPAVTVAAVRRAATRYIEMTANTGGAAHRMPAGDLVIDLASPELTDLLPTGRTPSLLVEMCKRARTLVRHVSPEERRILGWDKSRTHAIVLKKF